MPNIVTKKFKLNNAKTFIDSVNESGGNSLYMFLARPNPWVSADEPTTPEDTQTSYSTLWDEIVSLKRINQTDVSHVVKRINWAAKTIYAEYDNLDNNLFDKNFYVVNTNLDVYKCIDNFNGAFSTVEPTGKNLNIFTTSDGYKWKYLYSISTADRLKFLTTNWMPVKVNSEVAAVAKDGAIENIKILNGGLDYSIRANVVIEGDGRSANIGTRQSQGVIYDFIFNNNGTGFRYANAYVSDTNSSGRGANIRAIISPVGGHGSDPVSELGAHYVMINSRTSYNEGFGDFPENFSYRKIGIIKNPKNLSGRVANATTLLSLRGITLSNVNGTFSLSEFVEGLTSKANAYAVAANISSGNGYVRYMQSSYLTNNYRSFTIGETIIGKTSGATALVANTLPAETTQDTGDILYIENRTPITRTINQTDNLHLVLEF